MIIKPVIKWFGRWLSYESDERNLALEYHEMCRIVEFEQARVQRSGSTLSLLTFKCDDHLAFHRLSKIMLDRLRLADEFGHWRNHALAVALPDTCAEGARKVAGDLCELAQIDEGDIQWDLFCYPSHVEQHETVLLANAL